MKYRVWLWLLVGGVPLIVYPVVLLANVMALAGQPPANPLPLYQQFIVKGFLWGATLYPIVYLSCFTKAIGFSRQQDYRRAVITALLPLLYLVGVAMLFAGWAMIPV